MTVRIVYVAAGAAGMYCGACAGDAALVRGLRRLGCDAMLVPLYTPLRFDGETGEPAWDGFLGGVNVYLQHRFALFRRTPRWLDRLLDSRAVLGLASRFAVRTRAEDLGPLTLAVLEGEDGAVRKEVARLNEFLASVRPDVIVLTNSMLSGIVPALKGRLPTPVICRVQGEDEFIAAMPEPHRGRIWERLRANARLIERFVAPDADYAARMAGFLGLPTERISVVRPGIEAGSYPRGAGRPRSPFVIGHLSRVSSGKGLDLLVEAVRILAVEQARDVRLEAAGQVVDGAYWREVKRSVNRAGIKDRVAWAGVPDLAGKVEFFHRCSVFSVPSRYAELRGTAVLEALASGVPVVLPDRGAFQDIVRLTGGGRLVAPDDARALAAGLASMMDEPGAADAMGLAGSEGVRIHYSADRAAEETLNVCRSAVSAGP